MSDSSNSKSAENPYFQRGSPESAPTHIRYNLARHLGCHKVGNQQSTDPRDPSSEGDRPDCSLKLVLSLKHKILCGSENQDLDWVIETQPKSL